jgi:hypothetical protein
MTIDVAAVELLQTQWTLGASPSDVRRLTLRSIEVLPSVYQARAEGRETPRGLADKGHAAKLASLLKDVDIDLEPITVLKVGRRTILIDGHHRLEAYRSQRRKDIPVKWFIGSPKEALLEAGRENSKIRLSMTAGERGEWAWELVCTGLYSISLIVAGSGVSKRQVSNMRKARKRFQEAGQDVPAKWASVLREAWDDEDGSGETLKGKELIEKWVKNLNGAVGPAGTFKTQGKLCLLADALIAWGPKAMEHVFDRLFESYATSDVLLARLELERDELLDEIQLMKENVEVLKGTRDSLSPF